MSSSCLALALAQGKRCARHTSLSCRKKKEKEAQEFIGGKRIFFPQLTGGGLVQLSGRAPETQFGVPGLLGIPPGLRREKLLVLERETERTAILPFWRFRPKLFGFFLDHKARAPRQEDEVSRPVRPSLVSARWLLEVLAPVVLTLFPADPPDRKLRYQLLLPEQTQTGDEPLAPFGGGGSVRETPFYFSFTGRTLSPTKERCVKTCAGVKLSWVPGPVGHRNSAGAGVHVRPPFEVVSD